MGHKCIVRGCTSTWYPGCTIKFHRFPNEVTRRNLWLSIVEVEKFYGNARICNLHFNDADYDLSGKRLNPKAIPCVDEDSSLIDHMEQSNPPETVQANLTERTDSLFMASRSSQLSQISVCRACLVMGTKMFNIDNNDLQRWFLEITGITFFEKEKLPNTLCFQCVRTLKNCITFQEKCIRANTIMCNIIDEEGVLSHQRIQRINRRQNLLISNLGIKFFGSNHFDFYHTEEDEMKTEDIHDDKVEYLEELDEFVEGDAEYLESVEDQGTESDIEQIEDTDDSITTNDHMYEKTDDKEVIKDHSDDNIMTSKDAYKDEENELSEETGSEDFLMNEFDNKESGGLSDKLLDSTEDNTAKIMKVNRNNDVTDINNTLNDDDKSDNKGFKGTNNLETTKARDALKRLLKKMVEKPVKKKKNKRALLTAFTVVDLTLEEQLAEMEKRKESANYLKSNFKCPDCYKGFISEITYNNHRLRHTDAYGEFSCSICKQHFKTRALIITHISSHVKRFTCKECGFRTELQSVARSHRNWHEGSKFSCPHCDMTFAKHTTYFYHLRVMHPSDFVCQLCGFSFSSERGILQHKYLKHKLQDLTIPEDGPLCELCNIRFVNEEALNQHLLVSPKHKDEKSQVRNTPKLDSKKIITCEKCGIKNAGVRAHLKHFKKSHPGECSTQWGKPLTCELCGLNLEGTRAYLNHFKQTHPSHAPSLKQCGVECELCGVHSKGIRAYRSHFRQKHPGEAPKQCDVRKCFMCELCGKKFQKKAYLRQHSCVHTGVRGFKCELCEKTFSYKSALVNHIKRHTEPSAYLCELCGKRFTQANNRLRHMAIHNNERPHKCELCDKAFIMPYQKRAHIERKHNKKPRSKRKVTRPKRKVTKRPAVKVERLPEIKMDEE